METLNNNDVEIQETGYDLDDDEQCEYIYNIINYVLDDIFIDYFKHKFRNI